MVGSDGTVFGMDLLVERGQGAKEALRYAMLLVEGDGALKTGIGNKVAVCKVLSEDACTGLLLLCDLVGVTLCVAGRGTVVVVFWEVGRHRNLGCAKLGVVEEEGRLSGRLFLKSYGGALGLAFGCDIDGCDLSAAERKRG